MKTAQHLIVLALLGFLLGGCLQTAHAEHVEETATRSGQGSVSESTQSAPPGDAPNLGESEELVAQGPSSEPVAVNPELVASLNRFSQALFVSVAEEKEGNLAVSPLGSYLLLALLEQGAGGDTREAITAALELPPGGLEEVGRLVESLDGTDSLSLAQKIYMREQFQLAQDYLTAIAVVPMEAVESISFADGAKAAETINAWVEERTSGLIKEFLPPLPKNTLSVLLSVLHFKGDWQYQFDKDRTRPRPFYATNGTLQVPMMSLSQSGLTVLRTPDGQGVALPYEDDFEMLFLLPDEGKSIDSFAAELDLTKLQQERRGGEARIELPRFEFTVPTFSLNRAWKEVGLARILSDPDLKSMFSPPPSRPLDIDVYHQTYVKVDEVGTEAAAATAVVITLRSSAAPSQPFRLTFDRPFLFVLRHKSSGAALMLGRVDTPEEI